MLLSTQIRLQTSLLLDPARAQLLCGIPFYFVSPHTYCGEGGKTTLFHGRYYVNVRFTNWIFTISLFQGYEKKWSAIQIFGNTHQSR